MSVTQPLVGDGTLIARVVSERNTHVFEFRPRRHHEGRAFADAAEDFDVRLLHDIVGVYPAHPFRLEAAQNGGED